MNSSTSNKSDSISQSDLIVKLCNHLGKNDQNVVPNLTKIAFSFLSASSRAALFNNQHPPADEFYIVAQIKQILSEQSEDKVKHFELLYANICKSKVVQNRCAILTFMLNFVRTSPQTAGAYNMMKNTGDLVVLDKFPGNNITSTTNNNVMSTVRTDYCCASNSQESIKSVYQAKNKQFLPQTSSTNLQPSYLRSVSSCSINNPWSRTSLEMTSPKVSNLTTLVTDRDLLQDAIYSFQGIEGRYLRKEPGSIGFIIDSKITTNQISLPQRGLIERLIGISYLHSQLKQYCDQNDKQSGIICQALIMTLRDELSVYYKMVAVLQTKIDQDNSSCKESFDQRMTLRKALCHTHEHQKRFEWLAYIAEQCVDKKGGALITAIHGFLQHGANIVQAVSETVLIAVCKPLYIMLSRWLLDGEINDPYNEFFVEARNISLAERFWHDKYTVRKSMVPSFITMNQAKKILATGKSINFLRQICKDNGQLPGRDSLQKLFNTTSAAALFTPEQSIEFHSILEKVYRETSLKVLNLLKKEHKLFEHLQSLRRYLLLGQGDFIRHLLELLAPELNKPAQNIYGHTLSAILESAIRVTNAKFEDEDTLQRLNVSFMGHSHGDTGWDVFSLVYIVDGPVGTIFQPTMSTYQCLFGALWKAKRMEFVLANMRKQQITISKVFNKHDQIIKELKPVMHLFHVLTSEMIHFLHQTQYYFLFEVLECSWAEMLRKVDQAECLDDIIHAHTIFLNSVQSGVLLDEQSRVLFSQLRSIYNVILTFEQHQQTLYTVAAQQFDAYNECYNEQLCNNDFALTLADEIKLKQHTIKFQQSLISIKTNVKHLSQTYEQFVKNYLKLLSCSANVNLQLLSVRLSFNDYYKIT